MELLPTEVLALITDNLDGPGIYTLADTCIGLKMFINNFYKWSNIKVSARRINFADFVPTMKFSEIEIMILCEGKMTERSTRIKNSDIYVGEGFYISEGVYADDELIIYGKPLTSILAYDSTMDSQKIIPLDKYRDELIRKLEDVDYKIAMLKNNIKENRNLNFFLNGSRLRYTLR